VNDVLITAVSDLHGSLDFPLDTCDLLTISGDICPVKGSHGVTAQLRFLNEAFYPWCSRLIAKGTVKAIVFTPGNHDFVFGEGHNHKERAVAPDGVHCLIDEKVALFGLHIYGTPWAPRFGNWAFMEYEKYLQKYFDKIPAGLDLLLTHGPAYGLCDTILEPAWEGSVTEPLGSVSLRHAIARDKPRWVFCGHIHTGSHTPVDCGPSRVVNVSLVDERYQMIYKPFVLRLAPRAGGDE
jgi:Icc-related predicted phosphoesterase